MSTDYVSQDEIEAHKAAMQRVVEDVKRKQMMIRRGISMMPIRECRRKSGQQRGR